MKNYKRTLSFVILIIGVFAIAYAIHGMQEIKKARGDVEKIEGILPKNIFTDIATDSVHKKIDSYVMPVRILLIGGIIFTLAGGVGIFYFKKKR